MIEDERFPRCHMPGCQLFFGHSERCLYLPEDSVKSAAAEVFYQLGSGHSESVYEAAMSVELLLRGFSLVNRQVPCTISYKGFNVGVGYIDIMANNIIIELKSVAKITPKDVQQVRKYLEAIDLDYGLLINFGNSLEIAEVKKGEYEQTPSSED